MQHQAQSILFHKFDVTFKSRLLNWLSKYEFIVEQFESTFKNLNYFPSVTYQRTQQS
jgi:hypothetical protein